MKLRASLLVFFWMILSSFAQAQQAVVSGRVMAEGASLPGATVGLKGTALSTVTNSSGEYELRQVPYGSYTIVVFLIGKQTIEQSLLVNSENTELSFTMLEMEGTLSEVIVEDEREHTLGLTRLQAVENFGINEGKKNEVILISNLTANLATNNPRQIYSRITGLNIWESDGVGLQLGIGGRGLSPNRTSNFNTRQNGYDISADALGYPESYYTPPAEALERIEIIRGASSLQFGTQFGGMLNFRFKQGPRDKKMEVVSRQSIGSWNFFGSFNSIGGTVAKDKLNYYAYYQFKTGDGYRPNSEFDYHNAYVSLNYQLTKKLLVNLDYTRMTYLAQQPGGLTDFEFEHDPTKSKRPRNWFKVDWNLLAVNLTYSFSPMTQLNIRNFGLLAQRQSLGNLNRINTIDTGGERTLIDGEFNNIGNETRLLHRYSLFNKTHAMVAGVRLYYGYSTAKQGNANDAAGPDFYFLNPDDLENSDYQFPNRNYAAFVENIFELSDKFSLTPGIRFENIQTFSKGYYQIRTYDGAGNLVAEKREDEDLNRKRSFVILGLGASYKWKPQVELYANFSQNYRAINFTDLRIANPSFRIDPGIQDEKGFTLDAGIRGGGTGAFNYEVTAFHIAYKDRIGQKLDTDSLNVDYRLRKNISDASIVGIESFVELNLSKVFRFQPSFNWTMFLNSSFISAYYINTEDNSIRGNKVEMVPPFMIRTGTTGTWKGVSLSLQYGFTAEHFSDASNAKGPVAAAVEGIIPGYGVMDISASWTWKFLTFQGSCNNVLDTKYFTRRAESYPGPGIIPSDGRGVYFTVQAKF